MAGFEIHRGTAPLVVAFPHTGTDLAGLDDCFVSTWRARRDADWHIHTLYAFARDLGATTIRTPVSRSVIDVNRDPSGASLYPGQATTELCPTTTFDGEPLYAGATPDEAEIARRRDAYFVPYHAALIAEITRLRTRHPRVVVYDAHSIRSRIPRLFGGELPQFNIGTNDGATCDPALTAAVSAACCADQVVDGRFKGGWTTRHYGRPEDGIHAIQMELAIRGYAPEPDTPDESNWPPAYDRRIRRPARRDAAQCPHRLPGLRPMTRLDPSRTIKAATGTTLSAKSWLTEAPLRMLMNNLHPDVAERPEELVVYGGIGRAARDWESYDRIVETLRRLNDDETLLVQSGKPVGVFRTHADAPRVLIANSNLVPKWANWEHFDELDRKGLAMYGQMTAGSWIYIGTQGIVQGTYETFVEMGRQHYGGDLAGRWLLTAGLGGMGGAQPLAAVMAGASCLAIECQQSRIEMRLRTGYLDRATESLDEALDIVTNAKEPISVGLLGNAAELLPEMYARGVRPDLLTDQTSAHDPVNGYLPAGWTVERWIATREQDPATVAAAASQSMATHVRAMLDFQAAGVPTVDYGNNIRQVAKDEGSRTPSPSPASFPPISARCSVAASARSAGSRCRAIPRTSTGPTPK